MPHPPRPSPPSLDELGRALHHITARLTALEEQIAQLHVCDTAHAAQLADLHTLAHSNRAICDLMLLYRAGDALPTTPILPRLSQLRRDGHLTDTGVQRLVAQRIITPTDADHITGVPPRR